jgi:drug/metabolite transporter (DMT)-like permease
LLLNFEGVATVLIAAAIFKEAIGRRVWLAMFCVSGASVLLSLDLTGEWGVSLGAIGVLVACALWGIDNNFTCNISAKDPVVIVIFKGIGAGLFSLALAFSFSTPMPSPLLILFAMLLGFFSYGLSIVLFILSMRSLGAARTSAFSEPHHLSGCHFFLVFQESPILFSWYRFHHGLGAVLLLRRTMYITSMTSWNMNTAIIMKMVTTHIIIKNKST